MESIQNLNLTMDNVTSVSRTSQNNSKDTFGLLFRKLSADLRGRDHAEDSTFAYLVLLQHSLNAKLRLACVNTLTTNPLSFVPSSSRSKGTDENVYRRAGLRTPSENAWRDLQGQAWIRRLTETLCHEYASVTFVRTLTKRPPQWTTELPSNVRVIDTAQDPFGWSQSESSPNDAGDDQPLNLNSLDRLLEYLLVQNDDALSDGNSSNLPSGQLPLVIQSISPIIQRHGFSRTYVFLQNLSYAFCPLVVPVNMESLNTGQHAQLEELAQAFLYLNGGDATLIRRGVHERDNVVRESLSFEVPSPNSKDSCQIQFPTNPATVSESNQGTAKHDSSSLKETVHGLGGLSLRGTSARGDHDQPSNRKGVGAQQKVALALSDDDAPRKPSLAIVPPTPASEAPSPRIIIQDDDPEYHDYDEEDPDDDLDI